LYLWAIFSPYENRKCGVLLLSAADPDLLSLPLAKQEDLYDDFLELELELDEEKLLLVYLFLL
jgi:hypothetical protein